MRNRRLFAPVILNAALAAICAMTACRREDTASAGSSSSRPRETPADTMSARALPPTDVAPPLPNTITTRNGLISVRYGDAFTARALDDSTLGFLSGTQNVTVAAVQNPYVEDPALLRDGYLKVLRTQYSANGVTLSAPVVTADSCAGRSPASRSEEVAIEDGQRVVLVGCSFVKDHVGVIVAYLVSEQGRAELEPEVLRMLSSIELHPLARPDWKAPLEATPAPGGLIVAHHPGFYAASATGATSLTLRGPDRSTIVLFATSANAQLVEAAWWDGIASPGNHLTYREERRGPGSCFGGHRGTEAVGVRSIESTPAFDVHSCFFIEGGRAFGMSIEVPVGAKDVAQDATRVVEATELAAPDRGSRRP